jgi:sugar phosphate isomerase/epimerase
MLLAGQNKYWGKTLEDSTKTWLGFGISHLMIKSTEDTPLISSNGTIREEDFKRLGRLQKEYGVKYHLHPYNIFVNIEGDRYNLDCITNKTKVIYAKALKRVDELIQENELYPLITFHTPVLDYPNSKEKQEIKKALGNGREFFQSLELESTIGLETHHDPYRNPGWSLLGNEAWHFSEIIGNKKNISLVLDTGHLNMAKEPLRKFVDLPYDIVSLHFNGNNGKKDSHEIPTRDNMKDVELIEELLKKVKGPIVLEIQNYGYSKGDILKLIENTKAGKVS